MAVSPSKMWAPSVPGSCGGARGGGGCRACCPEGRRARPGPGWPRGRAVRGRPSRRGAVPRGGAHLVDVEALEGGLELLVVHRVGAGRSLRGPAGERGGGFPGRETDRAGDHGGHAPATIGRGAGEPPASPIMPGGSAPAGTAAARLARGGRLALELGEIHLRARNTRIPSSRTSEQARGGSGEGGRARFPKGGGSPRRI